MVSKVARILIVAALCLVFAGFAAAQTTSTGTLTGAVTDPTPAAIIGAQVHAVDDATGASFDATTGDGGVFTFASLKPGSYTVTVTKEGFKKGVYKNVKVIVNQTYTLEAKLEIGEIGTSIVVEAGQEVLETASTNVGTTITGKAITNLPFTSRDALDLAVLMPGVQTTGRPRQSSVEGLPKGAINVTIDGINVQDEVLKSSDGFFATIRPRIDDIQEFSITTAGNDASQNSEGAVQIHFVSSRGGNAWHGGGWEYLRNDWFNANYFFSNQNKPQLPRQIFRLNEYGGKVGGPIFKDKLFFFADMDVFSEPQTQVKTRTLLTPAAVQGSFIYQPTSLPTGAQLTAAPWTTCNGNASAPICTVNLYQLAGTVTNLGPSSNISAPTTPDPFIANILGILNGVVPGSNGVVDPGTPCQNAAICNQRSVGFNVSAVGKRYFPDFRLDWNISKKHTFEFDYHYSSFNGNPDFLNGAEYTFPVAPFINQMGGQISNRNLWVWAWRWNVSNNVSNEMRFGIRSAPISFFPNEGLAIYPQVTTNLGNARVSPTMTSLMTNPFLGYNRQGRNDGLGQLIDTLTWAKGTHSINVGMSWYQLYYNDFYAFPAVGSADISTASASDLISAPMSAGLVNMTSTDQGNAASLYTTLVGRVASYSGSVYFDPSVRQLVTGALNVDREHQKEFGFYVQDSWRVKPSLTFNYGLRWEYQGAPKDTLNEYFTLQGGLNGVAGVSGSVSNLFKPGTMPGSPTVFTLNGAAPWYNKDLKDFAPTIGAAWQPNFENSLLKKFFGGAGKTVLRAGYSISYTREGLNTFFVIAGDNAGYFGSQSMANVGPVANCDGTVNTGCAAGTFAAGTIKFNSMNYPNVSQTPSSFQTSFALSASAGQSAWAFNPNLKVPRVQSWSVGIQRELSPSMVVEARYVGNHGTGLWRTINLNETNIFENGFLQEYTNAKNNLAVCNANLNTTCLAAEIAAGIRPATATTGVATFANLGLTGQVALPIMTASFTGTTAQTNATQSNANFRSGAFITNLGNGTVGTFANSIAGNLTFWNNFKAAGYPSNLFRLNPDARGGANMLYNGGQSTYNALVIEFRRRPSKGLQFSANYSFSRSLTDFFADTSTAQAGYTTLRNTNYQKGFAPFDLRHQFKAQGIYELPFGPGRKWSSSNWIASRLMGGWQVNTIFRWQSGRITALANGQGGTFNQNDPGIVLTGLTRNQLQSQLGVSVSNPATPPGIVTYWPASLLASNGTSNQSFVAPCGTAGSLCGRVQVTGPRFFRADISLAKTTKITERISAEIRAEALNAFNNINFLYGGTATSANGSATITSTSLARITAAYQDISTTDDPGGRIIQMVFRINF